jgi:moderate conductance mechanosensitive channel
VARRLVERLVGRVVGLGPSKATDRSSPRTRSLSGAIRSLALVAIWTVAVIAVMDELGVDVGGVVFTATVIGGALAFGAQTLVRDLIAGMFVLAEDQYGVGDVIDVGPLAGGGAAVSGTVERISLRATRLRDGEGRVWHVPNGAVVRVANLSLRSVAVLELHVERATRLEELHGVAEDLCQAILAHPEAGPLCVEPAAYSGVVDMRDDRLVGRVTVRTQPGRHDDVKRIWRELSIVDYQSGRLRPPPVTAEQH